MVEEWPFGTVTPVTPDPDTLIDAATAANILGVNLNHLRQLVFKKKLVVVERQGRKTFYNRTSVVELREKRSQ